jgi:hypothetical protein
VSLWCLISRGCCNTRTSVLRRTILLAGRDGQMQATGSGRLHRPHRARRRRRRGGGGGRPSPSSPCCCWCCCRPAGSKSTAALGWRKVAVRPPSLRGRSPCGAAAASSSSTQLLSAAMRRSPFPLLPPCPPATAASPSWSLCSAPQPPPAWGVSPPSSDGAAAAATPPVMGESRRDSGISSPRDGHADILFSRDAFV